MNSTRSVAAIYDNRSFFRHVIRKRYCSGLWTGGKPENLQHFDELLERITQAEASGETHIISPWNETELPLDAAKTFSKNWEKQQKAAQESEDSAGEKAARAVLKIEQNIEEAVYIKQRRDSLLNARHAEPEIPLSLKEHIRLKDHQREDVAWLQQLFLRSPQETVQKQLYLSSIANWQQQRALSEGMQQAGTGMPGLLHRLKLICAHPAVVNPEPRYREGSPKLSWMLKTLDEIKHTSKDKVIIFTELRDLQREIQHAIHQQFGFRPVIINGDTNTKSQSQNSRQRLIDDFQAQPGFGVNVQKANHVIHFTRCWNPAKEDQATDRAYRIGQTKDVYVYYSMVRDCDIKTFEETLDELLNRRRALARDMLCTSPDLINADFEGIFKGA